MNFDFLLNLFSAALETAGESKLMDLLQELHDSNPADYQGAVTGGHALVKHLLPLVSKSKNKIDDAIVNALNDAIDQSAAANGVVFDDADSAKGTEAASSTPEA